MSLDLRALARTALTEIDQVVAAMDPAALDPLLQALHDARRIVTYGVGREGLMMKALAMRLYHLGLDAHVVGDMTTPPVGGGDLLLVSAGPGDFATVSALVHVAKAAGAQTACVTAQPAGPVPRSADIVMHLPAQTMADDQVPAPSSVLPMGSLYEGTQYIVFEVLVLALRERLEVAPAAMRARHANLE